MVRIEFVVIIEECYQDTDRVFWYHEYQQQSIEITERIALKGIFRGVKQE